MAQKRTSARKSGSAKRTSSKSAAASKTKKEKQEEQTAQKQMWAVVLFALSIFIFFLTLFKGASGWLFLHNIFFGLFGVCAYLIAPLLLYVAIVTALGKPIGSVSGKVWQAAALLALICGAIQIFSKENIAESEFFPGISELYINGIAQKGGGSLSAVIGWPLLKMLGKTGASITIVLVIFVFIMLVTGKTLLDLYGSVSKPVKKIGESYVKKMEEKNSTRFDIDVDLGPDLDALPQHPVVSTHLPLSSPEPEKESAAEPDKPEGQPAELKPEDMDSIFVTEHTDKLKKQLAADKQLVLDDIVNKIIINQKDALPKPAPAPAAELQAKPPIEGDKEFSVKQEPSEKPKEYIFPTVDLLNRPKLVSSENISEELKQNAARLVDTLKSFGVETRIVDINRGPAVTRYELQPSAGVKISKITNLADDIALNLAAAGVRIEAPIPNKAAVGIEVPNKIVSIVAISEMLASRQFKEAKSKLTVALGKDIAGNITLADIGKMPHVLIAGATGSGKSVCINSIIMSILYKASPEEVRLLMVDPKVVELGIYNGIPHLLVPVVTDPRKAAGALGWAVTEMLNRYKTFAGNNVRDLTGYNELTKAKDDLQPMPQIVIIIDELADLMMAAPNEVEEAICRLAQMARAAGMHLVIATQRPSVDVITGVIKANIPSRIAFAVSSQVDSRTILDSGGAEKLLGRGDMLFFPVGSSKPVRVQGCFVTDKEIEQVVDFIKNNETTEYDEDVIEEIEKHAVAEKSPGGDSGEPEEADPMLPAAIECVLESGQASTSLLQRRLKLGYARAARIIDEMESRGIVGPFEGSKPRPVLITRQQWLEMTMINGDK